MDRRNFLRNSVAGTAALAGTVLLNPAFAQEAEQKPLTMKDLIENGGQGPRLPEEGISCYPDTADGKHQLYQLWIRKNNDVLTSYRAHPTQKYPFFYPLLGPASGISLTSESGKPWPHHRSVFFGLDRVNGGNYWQDSLSRGQIVSQGPSFAKENGQFLITPESAVIVDKCLWQRDGESIIEDNRRFTLRLLDSKRYVLEAEINLKSLVDVTVQKTNHGLFGIRSAPDIAPTGGGILLSSEGAQGQNDTIGKPAKWLAFYGKRAGLKEEIVEGVAVFCPSKAPHPKFEKCPWFTRDYGNFSPTPCNFFKDGETLELPKDFELKLRYWVVAFAGTPKDADLDGLWEQFDKEV